MASRTEHVMGMPVTVTVRGGAPDLDPAFAWLEHVDALFADVELPVCAGEVREHDLVSAVRRVDSTT